MSIWTDIVTTAVVGTERQAFSASAADAALQALFAQLDLTDREGALLHAAALTALHERAGRLPAKHGEALPETAPAETLPRCHARVAVRLKLLLQGQHVELLPEFLQKLANVGHRVPEEQLSSLLQYCQRKEELVELLPSVIGARGRWLTRQNPEWSYVLDETGDAAVWETGSLNQRTIWLKRQREQDPANGRELLLAVWAEEPARNRAGFLAQLASGLSQEDEPLLERALDDKHKEVRQTAAALLWQIPTSALMQRMIARVRPLLSFQPRHAKPCRIEVKLPERCDKAMVRDGLEPKAPHFHLGPKNWWFEQLLCLVPPALWCEVSGLRPAALIEAARHSDWKESLLSSWQQAAERHRNVEWAEAFLSTSFAELDSPDLFALLTLERREALLLEFLESNSALDTEHHRTWRYLMYYGRQWSEVLSAAVIELVCTRPELVIQRGLAAYFLDNASLFLKPSVIPAAIDKLTASLLPFAQTLPAIEKFLDHIQFRYDMLQELHQ